MELLREEEKDLKKGAHFNPAETPALLYKQKMGSPDCPSNASDLFLPPTCSFPSGCASHAWIGFNCLQLSGPTQPVEVLEDAGNPSK